MAVNRKFVYVDENGVFTYAETPLRHNGHLYGNPKESHYRAAGAFPFVDERPAADETHIVEETKYADLVDGVYHRRYEVREVAPAPKVYSTADVIEALMAHGVWAECRAWIEEQGLLDLVLVTKEFDESYPNFVAARRGLQELLGWTDEQVEALLAEAAGEGEEVA